MKKWWSQFQISNRLDDGAAGAGLPDLKGDPALRQFAERASSLGRALNHTEAETPPPFLHGAIMSALKERSREGVEPGSTWEWSWVAPAAVAVLVSASVITFQSSRRSETPASTPALVQATLRTGADAARVMPTAALSPLQEELNHVNQDLDRTAQALAASFPGL